MKPRRLSWQTRIFAAALSAGALVAPATDFFISGSQVLIGDGPADLIFADDVDSGTTSSWSTAVQ